MNNSRLYKYTEILIVGILACFFLMRLIVFNWNIGGNLPADSDHWLYCYTLEHQITRLLGQNPGGVFEGGFYFPYHKVSMLFHEPTWGISLAVLPVWLVVRDVFFIHNFGGIVALILSWIGVYIFARSIGCSIIYAFFAAMTFCLSGVSLGVIMGRIFFWQFFLIPYLGWLVIKIFSSSKIRYGFLFGIGYGYLAWSSAHLAIMGGVFLLLFGLWHFWIYGTSENQRRSIYYAFLSSAVLSGAIVIPFYLVAYKKVLMSGRCAAQAVFASNFANYLPWDRCWYLFKGFPFIDTVKNYAKGECPICIPLILLLLAVYYILFILGSIEVGNTKKKSFRYVVIFYYSLPIIFAGINMFIFERLHLIKTDIFWTIIFYCFFGAIIVYFRDRLRAALEYRAFFFFTVAIFMTLLTFGPYFMIGTNSAIPSPTLILLEFIPGFSGIRAVTRWGVMASFCLSLGVSLALTQHKKSVLGTICVVIVMILSFLEVFPGFYECKPQPLNLHQWRPRNVDIFLKNIPDKGAVLELYSYPPLDLGGPEIYARLFHKRPVVTGNGRFIPGEIDRYLYSVGGPISPEKILKLRKLGARYWVFHMDKWPKEDNFYPGEEMGGLRRIASLDGGNTLVYEDINPNISVNVHSLE